MPAFDIAPTDLANLLTSSMRPKVERVECRAATWLELTLIGVDTGLNFMGMSAPRLDLEIALRLGLLDPHTAEMLWEVRDLRGLPDMIRRAIPTHRVGRGVVEQLVTRMGWKECSELSDNRLLLHLRRMPMGNLKPEQIQYEALTMPGLAGNALTARLRILVGSGDS